MLDQNNSTNLKFCKKCMMSNTRPRISFDDKGICNACNYLLEQNKIDYKEKVL